MQSASKQVVACLRASISRPVPVATTATGAERAEGTIQSTACPGIRPTSFASGLGGVCPPRPNGSTAPGARTGDCIRGAMEIPPVTSWLRGVGTIRFAARVGPCRWAVNPTESAHSVSSTWWAMSGSGSPTATTGSSIGPAMGGVGMWSIDVRPPGVGSCAAARTIQGFRIPTCPRTFALVQRHRLARPPRGFAVHRPSGCAGA